MPCLSTVYGWKRSLTTTSLKKPLLLSSRWERVFTLYIIAWGGFPVIVSYWWSGQPVSKRHRINPFVVSNPKFVDFFATMTVMSAYLQDQFVSCCLMDNSKLI